MKRLFAIFILLFFAIPVQAEVLEAGVSIDLVPKMLFGTWRVEAKLDSTNSYKTFRPQGLDIWNMTRVDDKITLNNPYSGANAEISVKTVEGNLIVFSNRLHPSESKDFPQSLSAILLKKRS